MTFIRLIALGALSSLFVSCCCTTQTQQATLIAGNQPVSFKPCLTCGPGVDFCGACLENDVRESGSLRFETPMEKNFVPPCSTFVPKKDKAECDLVPCAIEAEMDRGRSARIKRLVQ